MRCYRKGQYWVKKVQQISYLSKKKINVQIAGDSYDIVKVSLLSRLPKSRSSLGATQHHIPQSILSLVKEYNTRNSVDNIFQ